LGKADLCRPTVSPVSRFPQAEPATRLDVNLATTTPEMRTMTILKWALIFLVVSIVAGLLGFTGVSVVSADIARVLFYVFLVIFLVLLILGLTIFRA
jgi:uncharacterized membrane protein YtjA (UPF0391 family)